MSNGYLHQAQDGISAKTGRQVCAENKKTKPVEKYYIGLDVGGTKCGVCVGGVSEDGAVCLLEQDRFLTGGKSYQEILKLFEERVTEYVKAYEIESIGIACGGPLDSRRGIIQSPPNLPDWENVEIVKYFEERFSIPTYLQNDANACAIAEWKFGAGKGTKNMIFMTFGSGLGAGLILDGKLYEGANGNAGEIGHVRLAEGGPIGFNKAGSAEGFCSGNGIKRLALIRAKEQGFAMDESLTTKDIFEKAIGGEKFYQNVVKESAEQFGRVVSILIDLFNPEVIVAGGVFMRNYDVFMPLMQPIMDKEALSVSNAVCRVLPAAIRENVGDYSALAVAFSK